MMMILLKSGITDHEKARDVTNPSFLGRRCETTFSKIITFHLLAICEGSSQFKEKNSSPLSSSLIRNDGALLTKVAQQLSH